MALLPPRSIGPLSECSGFVRVEGQLTGATVHVYAGGNEVAQAVATWSEIYECNPLTGIVRAVPGATVEIRVGNQVRGSAVAVDGTAAIA